MKTGARPAHWIAPLMLAAVFAAVDGCNGLEKSDSSSPSESGGPGGAGDTGAPRADASDDSTLQDDATGGGSSGSSPQTTLWWDAQASADHSSPQGAFDASEEFREGVVEAGPETCIVGGLSGCGYTVRGNLRACCGGYCIDPYTDPANCGACGHACANGVGCFGGACGCNTVCGGACVNLQTDVANCGACGTVCAPGATCIAGACTCPDNQVPCNGACASLSDDTNNCGSCGHTCPGGCAASVCLPVPQVLAAGQQRPTGIAADATSVYWTNNGDGTVMKVPLDGGAATTLASGQLWPGGIALTPTSVVFITNNYGEVATMPLAGGNPVALASGLYDLEGITVDAANVYVSSGAGVFGVPLGGGSATLFGAPLGPAGVAVDAANVYFTDSRNSTVSSVPLAAGLPIGPVADGGFFAMLDSGLADSGLVPPPRVLAAGVPFPHDIAVDSTSVFWTRQSPAGGVAEVPLAGGNVVTLASAQPEPTSLALDGANAYFTNLDEGGSIRKVPLGGGPVTTLTSGQGAPGGIAVDATSVYWTDTAGGRVMKIGK